MTPEQAQAQVKEAVEKRKQWGKHFSVQDVPTDFLDAVVLYYEQDLARTASAANAAVDAADLVNLKNQVVLANRQLGAAKSRETLLRKQLAELMRHDRQKVSG